MECVNCLQSSKSDPDFAVDDLGICVYCNEVKPRYEEMRANQAEYSNIISQIKTDGLDKKYDCLIGMSGGVDSSFIAHLCGVEGLRPLVVHFDNGWNSELAVSNINNIIEPYGFDLHTLVVDWEEFADLQRALIKSSVIDIEMASDHAIYATMIQLAKKHNIKYLLSGANIATESGMPPSWSWRKGDWINMRDIHKKFGSVRIKTFPVYSSFSQFMDRLFKLGPTRVDILDYYPYQKHVALNVLKEKYEWREYGGKHYESLFTAFYQAYILPQKFGVDKRISHLSALIRNGELSRAGALEELNAPLFPSDRKMHQDKEYFCKKLGFSEGEFDIIMNSPPRPHTFYKSDETWFHVLKLVSQFLKRIGLTAIVKRYMTNSSKWN